MFCSSLLGSLVSPAALTNRSRRLSTPPGPLSSPTCSWLASESPALSPTCPFRFTDTRTLQKERETERNVQDVQFGQAHMAMQLLIFPSTVVTPTGQTSDFSLLFSSCSESHLSKMKAISNWGQSSCVICSGAYYFFSLFLLLRFSPSSCTLLSEGSSTLQWEAFMLPCKCVTWSNDNDITTNNDTKRQIPRIKRENADSMMNNMTKVIYKTFKFTHANIPSSWKNFSKAFLIETASVIERNDVGKCHIYMLRVTSFLTIKCIITHMCVCLSWFDLHWTL